VPELLESPAELPRLARSGTPRSTSSGKTTGVRTRSQARRAQEEDTPTVALTTADIIDLLRKRETWEKAMEPTPEERMEAENARRMNHYLFLQEVHNRHWDEYQEQRANICELSDWIWATVDMRYIMMCCRPEESQAGWYKKLKGYADWT
jgi:hypothetical protein